MHLTNLFIDTYSFSSCYVRFRKTIAAVTLTVDFQFFAGKMYSTTLMATLNARTDSKSHPQTAEVQESSGGARQEMGQRVN